MIPSGPRETTGGWDHPGGRNLSQEERDTIRKLIRAGYSHRDVALRIGRSKATISRASKTMGIQPAKGKRPWTAQEDGQLIALANQHLSYAEISRAVHRSPAAVAVRLSFLRYRSPERIRYQIQPLDQAPAAAPSQAKEPQVAWRAEPEDHASPVGLPQEPDLYSLWHRAMYRGASA